MKLRLFKKWAKFSLIAISAFALAVINDLFIRPQISLYDRQLRYFDHFIAAIILTEFVYLANNDKKCAAIAYGGACLFHEGYQMIKRGYFQIDQFLIDILGIATLICIRIIIEQRQRVKCLSL